MSLEIKTGQTWITRSGIKVLILCDNKPGIFPICFAECNGEAPLVETCCKDGKFDQHKDSHSRDLVKQYIEPKTYKVYLYSWVYLSHPDTVYHFIFYGEYNNWTNTQKIISSKIITVTEGEFIGDHY